MVSAPIDTVPEKYPLAANVVPGGNVEPAATEYDEAPVALRVTLKAVFAF